MLSSVKISARGKYGAEVKALHGCRGKMPRSSRLFLLDETRLRLWNSLVTFNFKCNLILHFSSVFSVNSRVLKHQIIGIQVSLISQTVYNRTGNPVKLLVSNMVMLPHSKSNGFMAYTRHMPWPFHYTATSTLSVKNSSVKNFVTCQKFCHFFR